MMHDAWNGSWFYDAKLFGNGGTNGEGDSRRCMYTWCMYAPWSLCICQWCINVWCIHPWSLRLDYAACVCDAYIHDAAILSRKDGRTNQWWSWHACVWCMYSWCSIFVMHVQTSTLMHIYVMHVCIMHIHMLLDHVGTMHIHMILDNMSMMHTFVIFNPWLCCMCVWCSWNFVTNQPTNEQGDSRSRMERREHNIRVKADYYPARFWSHDLLPT